MSAPQFELVPDWGADLPDLKKFDVADIGIDENDDVYLLYRAEPEQQDDDPTMVLVANSNGERLASWGSNVLNRRAHGVTPTDDGQCFVVDEGAHCVRTFDSDGKEIHAFGSGPQNPAFAGTPSGNLLVDIPQAYPPFTRPTRLSESATGDRYVSDGYGNCCIHRFSADDELIQSWGAPGIAPGEFHVPHEVIVDTAQRVLVCDRENDRIQLFNLDGEFVEEWTSFHRPMSVVEGPDGNFYVGEGAYRKGHVSYVNGPVEPEAARVTVVDPAGRVLLRMGGGPGGIPGNFVAAHGITIDSHGDLYVAEVSFSVIKQFPDLAVAPHPAVQKFVRTN